MKSMALENLGSNRDCGLLLVGHGTRDQRGSAEFLAVARRVAELARNFRVAPCFLELAEPDISTGVKQLIEGGVRELIIAPLMLFAAGHVKRDIPRAVQEALIENIPNEADRVGRLPASNRNERTVKYVSALECDPHVLALSCQRFDEALAGKPMVDPSETLLILVARGSSLPEATAMMHSFGELRRRFAPAARVDVCFVAKAQPSLKTALARAARSSFRRVVVQPHLLFAGQVLEEVKQTLERICAQRESLVADARDISPQARWLNREWILTNHLGPSPLIAEAIEELATAAIRMDLA